MADKRRNERTGPDRTGNESGITSPWCNATRLRTSARGWWVADARVVADNRSDKLALEDKEETVAVDEDQSGDAKIG